jgi:uncharacterized protein YndB with AHSA1/START domain
MKTGLQRIDPSYRIWHAGPEGEVGGFECELLELVPHERIVLRWGFVGPHPLGGPTYDSQLTVTLREAPEGATELTLVHERLDDLREALPDIAEGVGAGWEMALDKLAALAEEAL